MSRMPVVFSGHGDPMIALREDDVTRGMRAVGDRIISEHGKPKAILAISAHWFTKEQLVQSTNAPQQIYDMFGFPEELYRVKYPVKGDLALSYRVVKLLGERVKVDNGWGIDHGTWTVLIHMFPDADIPVVQLSTHITAPARQLYELGRQLSVLRDEGYLIFGSGNVVHNLREIEWDNPNGSDKTLAFNRKIREAITSGDIETAINYGLLDDAKYAIPTPEHYLPLIYCLGAADGARAEVFNDVCNLGSLSMTGYFFD
ncbi:MAG: 4,5-DOPA dioxygenase extradiol [Selenomonadaceae bacterium]|nr:4,5-DOPA dioxygenase extradiol [Selenomonadaceae bacterium]